MHPMPEQGEPGCSGSAVVMKQNAQHHLLMQKLEAQQTSPGLQRSRLAFHMQEMGFRIRQLCNYV